MIDTVSALTVRKIIDSKTNHIQYIQEINSPTLYKLLGIPMALDGNTQGQAQLIQTKINQRISM
jgi:hypothetical protein